MGRIQPEVRAGEEKPGKVHVVFFEIDDLYLFAEDLPGPEDRPDQFLSVLILRVGLPCKDDLNPARLF